MKAHGAEGREYKNMSNYDRRRMQEDNPISDKMPKGMHNQGDAYWDQMNRDPYDDPRYYDQYDPRD